MAAPGWRLLTTDTLIVFPRPRRWNSNLRAKENITIVNETLRGVEYGNKLYERLLKNPVFRIHEQWLDDFEAHHDAVGGDATPFWFYPDSSNLSLSFYVKKQPQFDPQPAFPGAWEGFMRQWYDYELRMRTTPQIIQILA